MRIIYIPYVKMCRGVHELAFLSYASVQLPKMNEPEDVWHAYIIRDTLLRGLRRLQA